MGEKFSRQDLVDGVVQRRTVVSGGVEGQEPSPLTVKGRMVRQMIREEVYQATMRKGLRVTGSTVSEVAVRCDMWENGVAAGFDEDGA